MSQRIQAFLGGAATIGLVWVLVAGSLPAVSAERADTHPTALPNITDVARRAGPAVVAIQVEQRTPVVHATPRFEGPQAEALERFFRQFGQPQAPRRTGQGSGFVVDTKGHVITNAHVVKNAAKIRVRLADGRTFDGKLVGSDPQSDLAVVKIEATDLTPATLGDSDRLKVGEWVVAIGTPFGLQQTVTAGIVSATGRSTVGIVDHEDFIQTDAAINPGNSGGPLLNLRGEVVGVNSAIFSRSGGSMGIGFAIPATLAKHVFGQLTDHGRVTRGYLGVVVRDAPADLAQGRGALVAEIQADSAASRAGLRVGDLVRRIDGREITGSASLRNAVALKEPGTSVEMLVVRDGKTLTLRPSLGTRPAPTLVAAPR